MNAGLNDQSSDTNLPNPAADEKIREFCFELALALRRITGRKINQGLEELPKMIRDAIENANGNEPPNQSGRTEE